MNKEKILVIGASYHAKLTIDIFKHQGEYDVIGIIDLSLEIGEEFAGLKVLGRESDIPSIMKEKGVRKGIVAIGDNYKRTKQVERLKKIAPEFSYVSAIHPSVVLGSRVYIGDGCVVTAGVVINNDTQIGDHCYLAINVGISHDCKVGHYSSFSPGSTAGGNVEIGTCTAIGLGANILNGRKIGDHTVVGSGCLVYADVGDKTVVYGVPAKEIRSRNPGDPYL